MIDVHVHLHPPRLHAAIRRWFAENSPWKLEHPTEPHEVVAVLRAAGITRFAFCSYAHKTGMARELNAWLTQTSREIAGYGLPLATVHLDDADPAGDLTAAFDDGCIGLKIHEDVQQLSVDDPRFDPIYAQLTERQGFVLAHIGHIPWSGDTHNGPRRIEKLLERHPHLRFVVAHFGVPDHAEYAKLIPRLPNLYLDTTMAFTPSSPLFAAASKAFVESIPDSIVFGTDYPTTPNAYESDLIGLDALGLRSDVRAKILGENARALSPAFAGEA